ncbi:MAG: hypothetical protein IKN17_06620 [Ruminococcus sp.]|nr:hypothetical protein [Ruminococcus sp.]
MKAYLIDFENVKSKGLTGIEQLSPDDKVIIFYSENSDTISFEMHRKVMNSSADIEYLKVRVGGKNALDFQLSTLLGYLLAKELYTHIFIISGDKGFDKLHDFWNVSFADKNSIIVFRTQTLGAAVNFANTYKGKLPVIPTEPEPEEPEETAEPEIAEPEPEPVQPEPEPVIEEPKPVVEVKVTKASARRRGRKPQSAEDMIKTALLGLYDLSDAEIARVVACAQEAEDKEDFHNALAKIFKGQATELYKVLRPRYLRIREALAEAAEDVQPQNEIFEFGADVIEISGKPKAAAAEPVEEPAPADEPAPETPAEPEPAPEVIEEPVPADEPAPEVTEEPASAEEPAAEAAEEPAKKTRKPRTRKKQSAKAKRSALIAELGKLLEQECSEEEIKTVGKLFEETDTKQKLYLSIVKEYKKDRGCEIYKLIKSEYTNLTKLK